jgi:hypothetical protein
VQASHGGTTVTKFGPFNHQHLIKRAGLCGIDGRLSIERRESARNLPIEAPRGAPARSLRTAARPRKSGGPGSPSGRTSLESRAAGGRDSRTPWRTAGLIDSWESHPSAVPHVAFAGVRNWTGAGSRRRVCRRQNLRTVSGPPAASASVKTLAFRGPRAARGFMKTKLSSRFRDSELVGPRCRHLRLIFACSRSADCLKPFARPCRYSTKQAFFCFLPPSAAPGGGFVLHVYFELAAATLSSASPTDLASARSSSSCSDSFRPPLKRIARL